MKNTITKSAEVLIAKGKISARRQPYLDLFVQPDEKSCYAIRTPELCGIALKYSREVLLSTVMFLW